MITAFIIGLVAHVFNPVINHVFTNTPQQLRLMVRYVIGGIAILIANHKAVDDDGHDAKDSTYRLSAIMAFIGVGVLIGHMIEEIYHRWKSGQ